jgi:OH-DDVA oxygenase
MSELVLGIGTSHGPLLNTPPEDWDQRAAADRANKALIYRGEQYTYDELLAIRAPGFAEECELQVRRARHQASREHIAELGRRVTAAGVDVLVVVSSDHKEVFGDELLPQFAVYWGDEMRHEPFTQEQLDGMKPGLAVAEVANVPATSTARRGHAPLARHIIEETSRAGFDPAASRHLPPGEWENSGIPHGWGFIFQQVLDGQPIPPVVPVFVNTFWDPNPPSATRCFDFGVALGEAIRSFPGELRVGVVASGGLSHFVVDEELDRGFIKALLDRDADHLRGLAAPVLRSGTSELRNWIAVAGALQGADLAPELVGYEPCYRSEAGTGCAMAFMSWGAS